MQRQPRLVSKVLLRNTILQTDAHNRVVEEEECWRQYEALRAGPCAGEGLVNRHGKRTQSAEYGVMKGSAGQAYMDERTKSAESAVMRGQAHMDDVNEVMPRVYDGRSDEQPRTFWLRVFDAAESADPNRWGHSGYKELYPDEFKTSSESSSSDEDNRTTSNHSNGCRHRKRKRSRSSSEERAHKHKSKHKKQHHSHKKKKRRKKKKKHKHS